MRSDAEALTLALRGRWYGYYGLAFCPAHDHRRTPALRLAHGADGRLLALCSSGCAFEDIVDAMTGTGLLVSGSNGGKPDHCGTTRIREVEGSEERKRRALKMWNDAVPAIGTLVEDYLRGRGIVRSGLPSSLRYHRYCWHPSARRLPCMLALVRREGEEAPVGVHRTWLAGSGQKAEVEPAKAMLGPCAGGAVRLSGGDGALVVAEGIETALSLPRAPLGASPRV